MAQAIPLKIVKPIREINILDGESLQQEMQQISQRSETIEEKKLQLMEQQEQLLEQEKEKIAQLQHQIERISEITAAFEKGINQLSEIHNFAIAQHRNEIIKLSIAIAEKIVQKKISENEYDITNIILSTLENSPGKENITVRLNPEDLQYCKEMIKESPQHPLVNICMQADPFIAKANCRVETEKGIIEYYVDEHLRELQAEFGVSEN